MNTEQIIAAFLMELEKLKSEYFDVLHRSGVVTRIVAIIRYFRYLRLLGLPLKNTKTHGRICECSKI